MRRIYVVMGELEDTDIVDCYDGAYPTMERADERCTELEAVPDGHIWYWIELILEEEGDSK